MNALSAIPLDVPGHKRCLRSFVPLSATTLDAGTNSGWAHVAMLGSWEGHSKGSFAFTQDAFAQILANFSEQRNPIPWDYEHDTFNSDRTGPKPASGWVRRLELRNNNTELWAYVDWTPRAAQMIRDGEYRFCSPVVDFEAIDRRTNKEVGAELLSVALTNNPFLDGQHPLQLTWVAAVQPPPDDKPSAEPKGPPPLPPRSAPKPMAVPPLPPEQLPPTPPKTAADATPDPVVSGDAADANALLTALADGAGLDKAQTLAALMDMKDLLINRIQETVARDGTPAESPRPMSIEKKPDAPAQPAATAPADAPPAAVVATTPPATEPAPQLTLDQLERERDKQAIAILKAQVAALMAKSDAAEEAALVQVVDSKIAAGFIPATQRDNAIWAFKQDRKRAEEIYSQQIVPIGTRQSITQPSATSAPNAPPSGAVVDMSQFSREEQLTIDCLMGSRKTKEQAVQIVLAKRRN